MALMKDADIPPEIRQELMAAAVASGRISYYWLCDLFRRGRAEGASVVVGRRRAAPLGESAVSKEELRLNLDSATKALLAAWRELAHLKRRGQSP